MHNNLINDTNELKKVFPIKNLAYLTIFNNPIASKTGIRHFIVNSCPKLYAVDFNIISDEEKTEMVFLNSKFSSLNPFTKINWPIILYPST
jgi:hypothetical protein